LKINEFTAYKSKDYIQIVPLRDARNLSIPIVEKGKIYYEDEVVTDYLKTEKACSGQVLAVVRPLVPQYSHLSAYEDAHTLIIIDTYGNIQRIRSVIKALEANLDAPVDCKNVNPPEFRPNKSEAK
jgi:general secretion pathway protein D